MTNIELFAGAGGLALGLEKAGFKSLGLVEFNKHATKTLRKNRSNWNVLEKDITKIESFKEEVLKNIIEEKKKEKVKKELEELDLISGGFPCQAFSYAGKGKGFEDTRGTLFYNYALAVKELKPKVFLAENVKALKNHDSGKTLDTIIKTFEELGYIVEYKVLNSNDFNVAQKRERTIIIGIRKDIFDINKAIGNVFSFPIALEKKLVLKDVLSNNDSFLLNNNICAKYSDKKIEMFKYVPCEIGGYWKDVPKDKLKEYAGNINFDKGGTTGLLRRLSWDKPSLTILCTPAQKMTERCHPSFNRPLSVRESARIQSFPDEWIFEGSMAEQYKQIGNAVPVELAYNIGLSIKKYLKKK
jgi:DNA (cytosine-5)-methyltransferase 1